MQDDVVEAMQDHMRVALRTHFASSLVAEVIADDAVSQVVAFLKAHGLVVVPVVPTEAMIEAGLFANQNALLPAASCNDIRNAYTAMLAARGDAE
jgi:predicted transcriptional regulator